MRQAKARLVMRNLPAAEWNIINPVLLLGELGIETDTRYVKVGDGHTHWINLPYLSVKTATDWQDSTSPPTALSVFEELNKLQQQIDEIKNSGGGGGSVIIDSTLTQAGQAADAKVTGDNIRDLWNQAILDSDNCILKSGSATDNW